MPDILLFTQLVAKNGVMALQSVQDIFHNPILSSSFSFSMFMLQMRIWALSSLAR